MEGEDMKAIDEDVKDAIWARAVEAEESGQWISRRALARELGVSPQTVARLLDGPGARRGSLEGDREDDLKSAFFTAAAVAIGAWVLWKVWSAGPS
jgi:hypothetical protein